MRRGSPVLLLREHSIDLIDRLSRVSFHSPHFPQASSELFSLEGIELFVFVQPGNFARQLGPSCSTIESQLGGEGTGPAKGAWLRASHRRHGLEGFSALLTPSLVLGSWKLTDSDGRLDKEEWLCVPSGSDRCFDLFFSFTSVELAGTFCIHDPGEVEAKEEEDARASRSTSVGPSRFKCLWGLAVD